MNTNNVNSPKRRFRSFEGEWEQRKLGNIASMHARIGWQNLRTSEFLDNGDYYLITGTDFLNGRINFEKCHYVNKERYQQDKKIQVGKGSILITKDGTLGKVALVTDLNKPATLNAGVFNVVVKVPSINETYLYQYLAAPFLMDYVSKRATGGTIKHLNQGILVDFPVDIPSYKEQVTIGQFLVCLDNAVTLHQHKLDKLKNLKKAYLSEMFPAEGERVPKRRFPGFEGEWEQMLLGKIGKAQSGIGFPDSEQGGKVGIPFYKVSDMNNNGNEHEMVFANNYVTLEQMSQRGWKAIHDVPAIFFAKVGAAVLLNRKRLCRVPFLMDNNTMAFSLDTSKVDTNFAKTMFETVDLTSLVQIGALPSYNTRDVESISVLVPATKEQKQIGEFFHKLDNSITLQQQKLDKLNDLKKAYLNELFV